MRKWILFLDLHSRARVEGMKNAKCKHDLHAASFVF